MKRILLIDDSAIQHRIMGVLLRNEYELLSCTSGVEGIGMAKNLQPDLILLDYDMPMMSGRATFRKLREKEETRDIPVIFLTGVNDGPAVMEVLKLCPRGYLLKPVDQEGLLQAIHKVLSDVEQENEIKVIEPVHDWRGEEVSPVTEG